MKRTLPLVYSAILLVLILALAGPAALMPGSVAAAPPAQETPVPARPVIKLDITGESYEGLAGASCWLQAANDIRCELDPIELRPADPITIEQGESLTIVIESDLEAPDALYATLLDDLDTDGVPLMIEFEPATSAEYTVDLDPGQHRLYVVAEYATLEPDISFVSAVFTLEIPEAVVVEVPTEVPPTAEPTDEATPEPTVEPTTEPTEIPPTAVPPTATPRPTTVPATGSLPPAIIVVDGANQFLPSGTEYCVQQAGEEVCSEIPGSAQSMRIQVTDGHTVRIDSLEVVPDSLRFALLSNDLSREFDSDEIPGNTLALYAVAGQSGSYVLEITAEWTEGTAKYYFRVQIGQ